MYLLDVSTLFNNSSQRYCTNHVYIVEKYLKPKRYSVNPEGNTSEKHHLFEAEKVPFTVALK